MKNSRLNLASPGKKTRPRAKRKATINEIDANTRQTEALLEKITVQKENLKQELSALLKEVKKYEALLTRTEIFLENTEELLAELSISHRNHGHLKEYKSAYGEVSLIIKDLVIAQQFLENLGENDRCDALSVFLKQLTENANKLNNNIQEIEKALNTKFDKQKSNAKLIPSFANEFNKITVKANEDFVTNAKNSIGISAEENEPTLALTLCTHSDNDFKHWTGIVNTETAYLHKLEGVGTYVDGLDSSSKQYKSVAINLEDDISVKDIYKKCLLSQHNDFNQDEKNQIDAFCQNLTTFLQKNNRHPNNPASIGLFLYSYESKATPLPRNLTTNLPYYLSENYEETVKTDEYRDKIRTLAISMVNRFLTQNRSITEKPLRIANVMSPELAEEVMIICKLRNLRNPLHPIDCRNDTRYKLKPVTNEEAEKLAERLLQIANDDDTSNPLYQLLDKLPFSLKKSTEEKKSHFKMNRATPDMRFFATNTRRLHTETKRLNTTIEHTLRRESKHG